MRSIKDTWRPDQRPRNDREPALGVGVLSMLVYARTNETIQMFSDVSYETGDQQKGTISMNVVQNNSLFNIVNGMIAPQKSMLRKLNTSALFCPMETAMRQVIISKM